MAMKIEGIKLTKLKGLLSIFGPKLPKQKSAELKHHLELIIASANENDDQIVHILNFIDCCCSSKPVGFDEYIAFVMSATTIQLMNIPLPIIGEKARLLAHVFNTPVVGDWCHDENKVMRVAKVIWCVSSEALHINTVVVAIHGYNQLTFNVSMILIFAAISALTECSSEFRVILADNFYDGFKRLDIVNDYAAKQKMFEFLILFQTYQKLMRSICADAAAASDIMNTKQIYIIEQHLKETISDLQKTVVNDHKDLNENTTIIHCAQMVLNNIGSSRPKQ